jgi:hypothetical protein
MKDLFRELFQTVPSADRHILAAAGAGSDLLLVVAATVKLVAL